MVQPVVSQLEREVMQLRDALRRKEEELYAARAAAEADSLQGSETAARHVAVREEQRQRAAAEQQLAARRRQDHDRRRRAAEEEQLRVAEVRRKAEEEQRRVAEQQRLLREVKERRRAEEEATRLAEAAAAAEEPKCEALPSEELAPAPVVGEACGAAVSSEEVPALLGNPKAVRNVVVIAHVDAGKTTLTDALLARGGVISEAKAGRACHMDSGVEQERGITIKAAAVTLAFRTPAVDGGACVVNLIDSPGHVDFNAEVTSAMRVSDGALVVVDAVEGVQVQTELVLRQALTERVLPCLVVNKLDRLLTQLRLNPEETYQRVSLAVDSVAGVCTDGAAPCVAAACKDMKRSPAPRPEEGSVVFASGLQGWGFSVHTFARLYERRTGVPAARTAKKLWGEHFWNAKTQKWSSTQGVDDEGLPLPRGFCHFVLRPLFTMLTACQEGEWEVFDREVEKFWPGRCTAALPADERQAGEAAFGAAMRRLLPAADALVELAALRLPSPAVAQPYRADALVSEGDDPAVLKAVQRCDPDGPLVFYVTKLMPVERTWNFYVFGRVFSGRLRAGSKVHILGHGGGRVQRAVLMMARKEMRTDEVGAGCLAGVVGLDSAVLKTATVVDPALSAAAPLKGITHAVAPVVRAAVECAAPSEQPQLAKALRWLQHSDPLVHCEVDGGQSVVAAAGELHLELCLRSLEERMAGPPGAAPSATRGLKKSQPAVALRETVTARGPSCLGKSPAKLNRVWASAGPMADGLADAIERGEIPTGHSETDAAARVRLLAERWGWERDEARSIWALSGCNVLVDVTKGVPYLADARPHIVSVFEELCSAGPVCAQPLRGVCVYLTDAKLHGDHHHRGPSELIPAASRAIKAAILRQEAAAAVLEPVFRCTVDTVADSAGAVRSELPRRRGGVEDEQHLPSGSVHLEGLVPVATSFGLADALRALTGGRAFPSCTFDHWRLMAGSVRQEESSGPKGGKKRSPRKSDEAVPGDSSDLCLSAVRQCRQRMGLKGDAPSASEFEDKL